MRQPLKGKKMVKKTTWITAMILMVAGSVWAASSSYKYISAADLQKRIQAGSPMVLIDICQVEQFARGHIKGSIETNAYPVKTQAEKDRLAQYLPKIKESSDDVIIICPRGGGGAKNTFEFYKSSGVDEKRLLILEKGMEAWPFETEKK